jgi:hypothetical protein
MQDGRVLYHTFLGDNVCGMTIETQKNRIQYGTNPRKSFPLFSASFHQQHRPEWTDPALCEEVGILESVDLVGSSTRGRLFVSSRFIGVLEERTAQIVWKKAVILPRDHKQQLKRVATFRGLVLYAAATTLHAVNAHNGIEQGTLLFPQMIATISCGKTASVTLQNGHWERITEQLQTLLEETP